MKLTYDAADPVAVVWIERLRATCVDRVEIVAGDELALYDGDDRYEGAHAVLRAIGGLPLRAYLRFGLFGTFVDALFSWAERHPDRALRATRLLVGRDVRPTRQLLVRFVFLRMLGAVAACAFASIGVQLDGLFGKNGIAPAEGLAREAAEMAKRGAPVYRNHLSLYFLHPTDGMLHGLVWAGFLASILLVLDVAPALSLAVAWASYLSLVTVGGVFLQYQWDALLLESFLVAAFVVPWRLRPSLRDRPPNTFGIWIVRMLAFKLMFLSGIVKLGSGDRTWRNLTALEYHYWTQPLPAPTSAFLARLPPFVHHAACAMTLVIELGAPFLIFGPRRLRWLACALFVALQLGIASSGNYGFFNALTIVLSLSLLDDDAIERWVKVPLPTREGGAAEGRRRWLVGYALGTLVLLVSATESCGRVSSADAVPRPALALARLAAPLDSIHAYGLFAVMTTTRPEIVIEGSADGVTWKPYVFRYEPGPLDRTPRFLPLHLPRLDWQLWFAALAEDCGNVGWYPDFLKKLLEGAPEVNARIGETPFPNRPPLFLRSTLWDYRFAPPGSGAVWTRNNPRPFCPTVTLQGGQLLVVDE